jgi:hypothetical protein
MTDESLATETPDIPILDKVMAANMADTLHKHFPGHPWAVNVNGKQGIATVYNFLLSGQMGYILHLDAACSATEWDRMVMRAGGEILERYRQKRARANLEALVHVETDFAGRSIFLQ